MTPRGQSVLFEGMNFLNFRHWSAPAGMAVALLLGGCAHHNEPASTSTNAPQTRNPERGGKLLPVATLMEPSPARGAASVPAEPSKPRTRSVRETRMVKL